MQNEAKQGKGFGVTGFVLGLIGLIAFLPIAAVVAGQAILGGGTGLAAFWVVLTVLALGMSLYGLKGTARGLSIAGIVLSGAAVIFSGKLLMNVGDMQTAAKKALAEGDIDAAKLEAELQQAAAEATKSAKPTE